MPRQYFERKFVSSGPGRFQIWERRAGGNWTSLIRVDEYREQYGPYARWR